MLIDGRPVASERTVAVVNPATLEVIATVPDCGEAELDDAVSAARRAFPGWSATPIEDRRRALVAIGDAILAEVDPLTRLLTSEQGKPLVEARDEVVSSAEWLKGVATLEMPLVVSEDTAERRSETRRLPVGVVAAIVPWNYPLILAMFKVGPSLLAGNTIVLKPSPFTPLSTLRFAELAAPLLPPGVLNVVTGGDALGPWITTHPRVDKVSFTGSTVTGRRVMQSASATLKRLTLELGGNDAAIVLPDVDVDGVAEQLFWAGFRNSGQMCIGTKRIYIHADIYDRLKQAIVTYARSVTVGNGADDGVQLGPINNKAQYERVLSYVQDSRDKGHEFLLGGAERPAGPGYFVPVTILDNPPEDSRIVQEEQFGPILPLLRFDDIDEVIRLVNATEFGLAGSVWGADEEQALAVARRIASGTVWVNETQYLSPLAAFGGVKQSGLGVEGGIEGLMECTVAQTLVQRRTGAAAETGSAQARPTGAIGA
ncbi:MAG: aldehyde dehydrogenase family protein [Microvirga sp.]